MANAEIRTAALICAVAAAETGSQAGLVSASAAGTAIAFAPVALAAIPAVPLPPDSRSSANATAPPSKTAPSASSMPEQPPCQI